MKIDEPRLWPATAGLRHSQHSQPPQGSAASGSQSPAAASTGDRRQSVAISDHQGPPPRGREAPAQNCRWQASSAQILRLSLGNQSAVPHAARLAAHKLSIGRFLVSAALPQTHGRVGGPRAALRWAGARGIAPSRSISQTCVSLGVEGLFVQVVEARRRVLR